MALGKCQVLHDHQVVEDEFRFEVRVDHEGFALYSRRVVLDDRVHNRRLSVVMAESILE